MHTFGMVNSMVISFSELRIDSNSKIMLKSDINLWSDYGKLMSKKLGIVFYMNKKANLTKEHLNYLLFYENILNLIDGMT